MAFILDKSEKTLRNETVITVSPSNTHKGGFDDALTIMWVSGDISPLEDFLAMRDLKVVAMEVEEIDGQDRLKMYSELGEKAACLAGAILKAIQDGVVCDIEDALLRELAGALSNYLDRNISRK